MHSRSEKRSPWRALIVLAVVGAAVAATAASAQHARTATGGGMTPAVEAGPAWQLEGAVTPGAQPGPLLGCQKRQAPGTLPLLSCYGPDQIRAAYGFQPLLSHGINGAGRTIVIIDAYGSDTLQSDLATFDAYFGIPATTVNVIYPDGPPLPTDPGTAAGWKGETTLDVSWAHAIAPGATIDLVVAKSNNDADILSATKYVADHNLGDVVSQSFGEAEQCMDPSLLAQQHKLFERMSNEGITLFASTGDDGAGQFSCDGTQLIKAISTPASDPNVTGVGGTSLVATPATANPDGSVKSVGGSYQSESAWNEIASLGELVATGGGVSSIYKKPAYQSLVPSLRKSNMRWLPDISYNAAINGGVLAVYTCDVGDPQCGGSVGQFFFIFGGTSAGSPQWAALVALTDQLAHGRIGPINSELYLLGSNPLASKFLHDVTTGDNSVPDLGAGTGTPIVGYPATPGWDASTGLGSPKADALVPALLASGLFH
jgi:subtilase family serine protease